MCLYKAVLEAPCGNIPLLAQPEEVEMNLQTGDTPCPEWIHRLLSTPSCYHFFWNFSVKRAFDASASRLEQCGPKIHTTICKKGLRAGFQVSKAIEFTRAWYACIIFNLRAFTAIPDLWYFQPTRQLVGSFPEEFPSWFGRTVLPNGRRTMAAEHPVQSHSEVVPWHKNSLALLPKPQTATAMIVFSSDEFGGYEL